MLKTLSVSALFALTLSGTPSTAVGPGSPQASRSDEFVCLSDATVHGEIEAFMDYLEGEVDVPPTDPLPLYCLAKCVGPHASTQFRPIAGPTTPEKIVKEYPYVDPYKWCDYVAEKTCAQLGADVGVGESCFGSRL
ncbi:hypothetical protein [Nannocystis bainbridge]|uniref:Uncharacterized protein n=1 Tax=Nannocystis bainbridge TaxID=2995303 RepID=A0ABT5E9Z3_9BACT|nr:hypothetical protein [Nannocystis bainbridge]MDC0721758.1 hypothetical protein [Nannocystis bainbridge]